MLSNLIAGHNECRVCIQMHKSGLKLKCFNKFSGTLYESLKESFRLTLAAVFTKCSMIPKRQEH